MNPLKVTLIQSGIHWQDVDANLATFEEKIWAITGQTDIIVLPEMFNTGYSVDSIKFAEPMNSKSFRWMKQMAAQTKAVITGSIVIKEKSKYFNRLLWIQPDGQYSFYDKKHLFKMANEDKHFKAGNDQLIVSWKGWNIAPFICYDLRFPVWCRNTHLQYDLAIFVANWPDARIKAWTTLLQARAIENASYTIGVNRIGADINKLEYSGQSAAYSFKGDSITNCSDRETFETVELDHQSLIKFREKFPVHLDADEFKIEKD